MSLLKLASYRANDVRQEIIGDRKYPASYLTGELAELIEALRERDKDNIKEEFADSMYAAGMLTSQATGLNLPLIGAHPSVDKFRTRNNRWKDMFNHMGIEFDPGYLTGGSNFAKPEKIQKAFASAGMELSPEQITELHTMANAPTYSEKLALIKVASLIADEDILRRVDDMYAHVTPDRDWRVQELKKKFKEHESQEDLDKTHADVIMALRWANKSGVDTTDYPFEPVNNELLIRRLDQLEKRLAETGTLYRNG